MMMHRLQYGLVVLLALTGPAGAAERLPAGFVYLRDVEPSIAQDMRYAGFDNFTGHPLPGYGAPECVLRRAVAQALAQVQADLARDNLSLKVYDCYRPTRAVRAFMRWAQESEKEPEKAGARAAPTKRFFPALEKRRLFASGYIATHSAHSTGSAVDLTLMQRGAAPAPPFDRSAAYGSCTGPAGQRAPRPTIASTWAPASTASMRAAPRQAARTRPRSSAGAPCWSRPCGRAACTIISANGGTSVSARAGGRLMILRSRGGPTRRSPGRVSRIFS